jgi:hypothetical protein
MVLKFPIGISFHFEGLEFFIVFSGIRQIKNLDCKLLAFFIGGELDFAKSSLA